MTCVVLGASKGKFLGVTRQPAVLLLASHPLICGSTLLVGAVEFAATSYPRVSKALGTRSRMFGDRAAEADGHGRAGIFSRVEWGADHAWVE